MVSKKIVVQAENGLHIEPAKILARAAESCDSRVEFVHGHDIVNVKSLLNILSATVKKGDEVELRCTGPNEAEDMKRMEEVIRKLRE